jgi:hypothetical protein
MRIVALEKEVERYKTQIEAQPVQSNSECSTAELLERINTLEKVRSIDDITLTGVAKQNLK